MFDFVFWLKNIRRGSSRKAGRVAPWRRLRLESLEERLAPAVWQPLGPAPVVNGQTPGGLAVSDRVTGVATDPSDVNTIFIATAGGGVWKTSNGGTTWSPVTDNVTSAGRPVVESMGAIAETRDASGNEIVYAGTGQTTHINARDAFYGEGILVSRDGGATWTLENAGGAFTRRTVSKIVVDPSDPSGATAYAAIGELGVNGLSGNTGIWKTTNFGATWTNTTAAAPNNLSSNDPWTDVVIDPHTPATLYAAQATATVPPAGNNGVYKSIDGGTTWTLLSGVPSGDNDGPITLALFDNGTTNELFVSIPAILPSLLISDTSPGVPLQVLKSTNGGATFTDLGPSIIAVSGDPLGGDEATTLVIDPQNPNDIYSGGLVDRLESVDGGNSWLHITTDPAGNGPSTQDHAAAFDASGNLIDGSDGGVFKLSSPTSQANQRWSSLNTNLQITQFDGIAIDPTTSKVAYGSTQGNGTVKYTGSAGWTQVLVGEGGITRLDPTNHNTLYQSFPPGGLEISTNAGATFTDISTGIVETVVPIIGPIANEVPAYVLDSSGDVYYGTDYLNFSSNQGRTWSQIGVPGTNNFNPADAPIDAIAVSPTNNNVVYVSAGGKLFVTQNAQGNHTWTGRPAQRLGRRCPQQPRRRSLPRRRQHHLRGRQRLHRGRQPRFQVDQLRRDLDRHQRLPARHPHRFRCRQPRRLDGLHRHRRGRLQHQRRRDDVGRVRRRPSARPGR
jgi:hypothetical protein